MSRKWNAARWVKGWGAMGVWFARLIPTVLIGGAAGFLFLNARGTLYADPFFQVERIALTPRGLLTQADYEALEERTRGRSLFQINLLELSKFLERNPGIKRAEVVRSLPSQLNIFLLSRTPFVQARCEPRGPYYAISEDQIVLARLPSPDPSTFAIEDLSARKKSYAPGMRYENPYFNEWGSFFQFLRGLPILAGEEVGTLSINPAGEFTAVLRDGIELRFGRRPSLSGDSTAVLTALLGAAERSKILYLDLRYQDVIVKNRTDR